MAGRCRVYDQRKLEEMLRAPEPGTAVPRFVTNTHTARSNVDSDGMLTARSHAKSITKQVAKRERAKRASRHQLYLAQQKQIEKEASNKIQERILSMKRQRDAEFDAMYQRLVDGHKLTDHIDKLLALQDTADLQKKEQMFTEWEERIFNPITKEIISKINDVGHETISRLRREEYDKFLKAASGKQGMFLDIVMEDDYDPFVPNRRRVKCDTSKLSDPVKRVLTKAEEEKHMVDRSKFAVAKRPGRETLDVRQWHTGKIEATPHGHFAMMMKPSDDPHSKEKALKMTKSKVNFDHFNVARGEAVVRPEFPRGKRPEHVIRSMMAAESGSGSGSGRGSGSADESKVSGD